MPIPMIGENIFSELYLAVIKTNDGAGVLVARLLSAALAVVAFTALSPPPTTHPPAAASAHIPPTGCGQELLLAPKPHSFPPA